MQHRARLSRRRGPRLILPLFTLVLATACDKPTGSGNQRVTAVQVVAGDAQSGTVGAVLSSAVRVRATGEDGRPATRRTLTLRPSHGGTATATATDSRGETTVQWTLGGTAGAQTLEVMAPGDSVVLARVTATAQPGAAAALQLASGGGQVGDPGTVLRDSVVVRTVDTFGNGVPATPVSFSMRRGGGTLSALSVLSGADGRAAVAWTPGYEAVRQEIGASAVGVAAPLVVSAALDTTRAIVYVSVPDTVAAGSTVTAEVRVALDGLGAERRGLLAATLSWGSAPLTVRNEIEPRDSAEATASFSPQSGVLNLVTSRPANDRGSETAFRTTFLVNGAASGRVVLRLQPLALVGAGSFQDLLGRVRMVGGTFQIR